MIRSFVIICGLMSGVYASPSDDPLFSQDNTPPTDEHPVLIQPDHNSLGEEGDVFEVSSDGGDGLGRHKKSKKLTAKKGKRKHAQKIHKDNGDEDNTSFLEAPKRFHKEHSLTQEIVGSLILKNPENELLQQIASSEGLLNQAFEKNTTIFS